MYLILKLLYLFQSVTVQVEKPLEENINRFNPPEESASTVDQAISLLRYFYLFFSVTLQQVTVPRVCEIKAAPIGEIHWT